MTIKTVYGLATVGAILFLIAFGVLAQNQYGYPSGCITNATQRCVGNSIFWYDSCGRQQTWVKNCPYLCQNGQCINYQPPYERHHRTGCNNDNLYWYDSNGIPKDLYKNCSDNDECTQDSCKNDQCSNELKNDCVKQGTPSSSGLDVSAFCGIKDNSINLAKNITILAGQTINCLIIVKNISTIDINNVTVRADIPEEIVGTGELKIDGMELGGNITSGINLENFSANVSKIITFEGKVKQQITQVSAKQITGIVNSGTVSNSDSLTINFQPADTLTSTASLQSFSFVELFKRWYIWILIAIVLIFLFFVIFRRISSGI